MTDEEKKQPEGGIWPGILALRLLIWMIILSALEFTWQEIDQYGP
jgi:hypothetical protein